MDAYRARPDGDLHITVMAIWSTLEGFRDISEHQSINFNEKTTKQWTYNHYEYRKNLSEIMIKATTIKVQHC